jgi:hypothetical protein
MFVTTSCPIEEFVLLQENGVIKSIRGVIQEDSCSLANAACNSEGPKGISGRAIS